MEQARSDVNVESARGRVDQVADPLFAPRGQDTHCGACRAQELCCDLRPQAPRGVQPQDFCVVPPLLQCVFFNAEEFFEVYKGVLPEYASITEHLSSGPIIVMEIRQENVVSSLMMLGMN